jgi:hypothetical protein
MAITRTVAKKLCTKAEYEIVEASLSLKKNKPPLFRVKQKVTLARKLKDKYTDLSRTQSREQRGKAEPKGTRPASGNEGSVKKAELFTETLARFEAYLDAIEKEAAKKQEAKSKKLVKVKLTPKKKSSKSAVSKAKKAPARGSKVRTGVSSLQRKLEEKALKKKKVTAKNATKSMAAKSKTAKKSLEKTKKSQNRSVVIHSHVKSTGKKNQAKRDSK